MAADSGTDNSESGSVKLQGEAATRFRAVAARLNYMSQDRSDLATATMRICSKMSDPSESDLVDLKRIGRYLLHRPRAPYVYRWQKSGLPIHACSESDWAGDRNSRR